MTISNKQKITLTLETDIYLKLKTSDLNASKFFNDFLKKYFAVEETSKATNKIKAEMGETRDQLYKLQAELLQAEKKEQEEQKKKEQKEQKKLEILRNIPTGNDFYSKLAREKYFKENPDHEKEFKNKK